VIKENVSQLSHKVGRHWQTSHFKYRYRYRYR